MNIGSIIPLMIKGYDKLRKTRPGISKIIIKAIDKATKIIVSNTPDVSQEGLIWDKTKLNKFFTTKLITDRNFNFYHCNVDKLLSEIDGYITINADDLNDYDKQQITANILKLAQEYYLDSISNDMKLTRFTLLRHIGIDTQIGQLADNATENKIQDSSFKTFKEKYIEAVNYYEKNKYTVALELISDLKLNKEYENDEQYLTLCYLEIAIYYSKQEYESAHRLIIDIEKMVPSQRTNFQFRFYGIKGAVLSEKGSIGKDAKLVSLSIQEFEKQLLFLDEENFDDRAACDVYYNLGTSHLILSQLGNNDPEMARQYYELALEIDNTNPELYKNLGGVYSMLHLHDKEISCYKRALEINPDLFEALFAMGFVELIYNQDAQASIVYLEKALRHKKELSRSMILFYWLSEAYLKKEQLKRAKQVLENGLKYFPSSQHLIDKKIDTLVALQRKNSQQYTDELVNYIRTENQELRKSDIEKIAAAYYYSERLDELDHFLASLTNDQRSIPELMLIYFPYAVQLNEKKDQKANKILKLMECINLDLIDDDFQLNLFLFLLGIVQSDMKEYRRAIESFEKLQLSYLQGVHFEINIFKGTNYLELEEYEQARKYFITANKLSEEDHFDVYYGLCRANVGLRKTVAAKEAILKMAEASALVFSTEILLGKEFNEETFQKARLNELFKCATQVAVTKTINHILKSIKKSDITVERLFSLVRSYLREIHGEVFSIVLEGVRFSEDNIKSFVGERLMKAEKEILRDSNIIKDITEII